MTTFMVDEMISSVRFLFAIVAIDVAERVIVLFGHFMLRQGNVDSFKVPGDSCSRTVRCQFVVKINKYRLTLSCQQGT
jgi:hypothetical protein